MTKDLIIFLLALTLGAGVVFNSAHADVPTAVICHRDGNCEYFTEKTPDYVYMTPYVDRTTRGDKWN